MSAELTIAKTKFINVEIQNKTGWKLEAIKKKRQNMKEEINKRIELMTSETIIDEVEEPSQISQSITISDFIDNQTDMTLRLCDNKNCFTLVSKYVSEKFPNKRARNPRSIKTTRKPKSNKKTKKVLYKYCQFEFSKNPRALYDKIINNDLEQSVFSTCSKPENLETYWKRIFETESIPDNRKYEPKQCCQINRAISAEEVTRELNTFDKNTAPGKDGVKLKDLKAIPISNILIVLKACLIENKIPAEWKCGRTTLIPKTQKAEKPELFRPITVTSLWIRLLNKILSAKVTSSITLNPAQLGFQKLDGTAIGCLTLDRAFKHAKKNAKSLSVITIDFEKAFDSVSHNSIARCIKRFGLPEWLLHLIQDMYSKTTTAIGSETATVKRGIKQGDPLSSTLFNMVIDELTEKIAKMRLGPRNVPEGIIAYADDIVLIAQSAIDSELMLKTLETEAKMVGLKIKPSKCNYINWENVPKKIAITKEKQINLQNGTIKHLKPDKSFKYLGADINIHGIVRFATIGQFEEKLQMLSHAPLKPQQRLFYVRNYLIPGLQHALALMRVTKTELLNYDRCLRYRVKKMLKLPNDVHNAILHTSIKQGGLGIPSII